MCNPQLVIAGISAGLQYRQSVQAQKAQRDAQIRQNEIARKNLENKRTTLQTNLISKTKKNLKKIGDVEKQYTKKRSTFLASDRGFTGNTYNSLLGNYYDYEGNLKTTLLGNIEQDTVNFRNDYLYANDVYDSQTTYITNVDRTTPAISAGLSFGNAYYGQKAKQDLNDLSQPTYTYEEVTEYYD